MAVGSLPAGEVKDKFRATPPFELAAPDDSARESGPNCPKETRADNRETTVKVKAIRRRAESLFMGSHISFYGTSYGL
jgi:hypothetical protein